MDSRHGDQEALTPKQLSFLAAVTQLFSNEIFMDEIHIHLTSYIFPVEYLVFENKSFENVK